MIGHYREFIQFHMGEMDRNVIPALLNRESRVIQPHFPGPNIPEQAFPILGTDGHEIRTCLGIVVSLQSYGTAMVHFGVIRHDNKPFCFSNLQQTSLPSIIAFQYIESMMDKAVELITSFRSAEQIRVLHRGLLRERGGMTN